MRFAHGSINSVEIGVRSEELMKMTNEKLEMRNCGMRCAHGSINSEEIEVRRCGVRCAHGLKKAAEPALHLIQRLVLSIYHGVWDGRTSE